MESKKTLKTPTMKVEKQKKIISWTFIVLLIAQMFLFYGITTVGSDFGQTMAQLEETELSTTKVFVSDTVRNQLRIMLNSTRQSWIQYLTVNPDTELLQKVDGNYVYGDQGKTNIVFNPATMERKLRTESEYYDLYDKNTGNVIAKHVRPLWNEEAVDNVVSVVAAQLKAYGPNGTPLVYDSYTGQIIYDGTGLCNTPDVIKDNGEKNIKQFWKHPNCLNSEDFKRFCNSKLLIRKDTDKTSNFVSLFREPNIKNQADANNFEKYPLGKYHREFVEKIVLPYETVGVGNQEMQISIVIKASEQEIMQEYKDIINSHNYAKSIIIQNANHSLLFPMLSVGISLTIILFSVFMTRLMKYQYKISPKENK